MDSWIHPGLIFIFGALLIPLLRGRWRQIYLLVLPALAFWEVLTMTTGVYGTFNYLGFDIVLGRVDKLSLVFAHVFTLMSILGFLYGLHVKDAGQQMSACFYIGGSLGVTFAGDYLTVFIFWEMMAFGSVFLIWLRREPASIKAGFRTRTVCRNTSTSLAILQRAAQDRENEIGASAHRVDTDHMIGKFRRIC